MTKSLPLVIFKYCLLIIVICIFSPSVNAQLRQLYTDPSANNQINKICFYSPSEGFVGFTNWVGYTTDSGRTFTHKAITTSNVNYNGNINVNLTFQFEINGVKAFSADTLIVYGDYGLVPSILYSVDGGNTFTLVFWSQFNSLQLFTGIMDMTFPQNDAIGYAIDADRILKTTNKGATWTVIRTDPSSFFDFLEPIDDNNVIACSKGHGTDAAPKILKTSNGGSSWVATTLPPTLINIYYATFLTNNKGWLNANTSNVTGQGVYYTADGGNSWSLKNDFTINPFGCDKMHFINDSTGYATTGGYSTAKTTDSGKIWELLPRDNSYSYLNYSNNDMQVYNANQLWTGGGGHGFLQISTNGGGIPIPQAYFKIDTTNLSLTNIVKLINYSKPGYQYQWYKNNVLIGTSYSISYTHTTYVAEDTLQLIVSNGTYNATATQYQYFVVPALPTSTITSFTPTYAVNGATIMLTGTNLSGATAVSFGGVPVASFTVISATSIQVVLGANPSGIISVTTPLGTATINGFTSNSPYIYSFSPTSGGPGTIIEIDGANFGGGSGGGLITESIGGVPAIPSGSLGQNSLLAAVGNGASSGSVTVHNNYGTGTLAGFTFIPPPQVISFSPTNAYAGTTITIKGKNFTGLTAVRFGSYPNKYQAGSFTFINDSLITAVVDTAADGFVYVTTTPTAIDSLGGFSFINPFISGFTPTIGATGTPIQITGKNFDNTISVSFGGVAATSFVINSSTSITAIPAVTNSGNIHIVTTHGYADKTGFLYNGVTPTINSFLPKSGPIGTTVYLQGANFNPSPSNNIVYFGAVKAIVTAATNNTLTVIVPAGATYQPISVTTNQLTAYSNNPFVVTFTGGGNITKTTYPSKINYSTGSPQTGLAMGDYDGDGKSDIAVKLNDTVIVYKNISTTGNVALAQKVFFLMSSSPAGNIISVDIDGDGKLDIVGVNSTGISVLKNISTSGNISFAPEQTFPLVPFSKIAFGDFNGDGKPDIIGIISSTLYIITNTSTNNTISFDQNMFGIDTYTANRLAVTICDFDGDGRPDIATTDNGFGNNAGAIYKNLTRSNILAFSQENNFGRSGIYPDISAGDIDLDGKPDLIYMDEFFVDGGYWNGTNTITQRIASILENRSNNTDSISFIKAPNDVNTEQNPYLTALADLNGDSKPDIAILDYVEPTLTLNQNHSVPGTTSFPDEIKYDVTNVDETYQTFQNTPSGLVIGDLDGDGKPEICLTNFSINGTGILSILANKATDSINIIICKDATTATVTSTLTGTNYQWQVNSGSGFIDINNDANYSGTATDTLTINNILTSWNGYQYRCTVNGATGAIATIQFSTLVSNETPDVTICLGNSATLGIPEAYDRNLVYSYISSRNDFFSTSVFSTENVYPTDTTTYYLSTTDGTCTVYDTVIVNVNAALIYNAGDDTTICNHSVTIIGTPSVNSQTYSWSSSPVGFISNAANPTVTPITTTSYFLTVTGGGCSSADTIVINVDNFSIALSDTQKIVCGGNTVLIGANPQTDVSYSWSTLGNQIISTSSSFTVSPQANIIYYLTARDSLGCSDTANVLVVVSSTCSAPADSTGTSNSSVSLYPNPATDHLTINLPANNIGPDYFILTNSYGSAVRNIEIDNNSIIIPVTNLASGIYYYTIKDASGKKLKSGKLTIAH